MENTNEKVLAKKKKTEMVQIGIVRKKRLNIFFGPVRFHKEFKLAVAPLSQTKKE